MSHMYCILVQTAPHRIQVYLSIILMYSCGLVNLHEPIMHVSMFSAPFSIQAGRGIGRRHCGHAQLSWRQVYAPAQVPSFS